MNIITNNTKVVKAFIYNTYHKLIFESKMSHKQALDSIKSRLYNRYDIITTSKDIESYINQVVFKI